MRNSDFYFEFNPYHPLIALPKGAHLGQLIPGDDGDTMYRIVRNGSQVIGDQPQPVDEIFAMTNNGEIHGMVSAGRNIVPLFMRSAVDVDEYRGGRLTIFDGAGYHQYVIQTNSNKPAGDGFVNLTLTRALISTIAPRDADDAPQIMLTRNPYAAVVPSTATAKGANVLVAGISIVPVPKEYYFLALVRGISTVTLAHDVSDPDHTGHRAITKVEPVTLSAKRIARVGLVTHPAQQKIGHLMEHGPLLMKHERDTLARISLI